MATLAQWDDHEVVNNWWPEQVLNDNRYTVKDVSLLAARAKQAFFEYMPIAGESVNRVINYGPSLDIFMLDMRSYRAPNGPNDQADRTPATELLGRAQIRWLKQALLASNATWKVIAADMPLGLVIFNDFVTGTGSEAVANGNGQPLGRELEIVDLLRFIKYNEIRNTVWLTADVHYTAAHYYDPTRRFSRTSTRSTNSSPARSTLAPSAPTCSTTPSARRCSTSACRQPVSSTCRPRRACSSSAKCRSTARARC